MPIRNRITDITAWHRDAHMLTGKCGHAAPPDGGIVFIQIGNGTGYGLHHQEHDVNDAIIPTGASYWVNLAEQRLPA